MNPRYRVLTAALGLSLPFALAACGSDSEPGGHGGHQTPAGASSTVSVAPDEDHNAADITFATQMMPHHAQALSMTDLVAGRTVSPAFQELIEAIMAAQSPEINTMTGWLLDWGVEVPATGRDHENAHGSDAAASPSSDATADGAGSADEDHDMAGMMTDEQMQQLRDASDADFEKLWLQMMIEHHEGAVAMAEIEVKDGKFPAATAMAQAIIDGQEAEIETMRQLIAGG